MTAQIGDKYKYQKKEYTIVALSSSIPFKPEDFGLEPNFRCTACWRGYWCEYAVEDEELVLKNLYIFNMDGKYPPLNGVEVSPEEFEEGVSYVGRKKKAKKVVLPAHLGHRVYKNVNLSIPYTGKILLGDGFMQEHYIHMGFQRGWAYEKLIELVFIEGVLLECNDLSRLAKEQRKAMEERRNNPKYPEDDVAIKFIEDSFSLDYADKAWWI